MSDFAAQKKPEELLAALKSYPSLALYNLSLYKGGEIPAPWKACADAVHDPLGHELSRLFLMERNGERLKVKKPVVYRHSGGLLCFVVPFATSEGSFYLAGDGVRDTTIDLWQLSATSRGGSVDLFVLLNHAETLSVATVEEVEHLTAEVQKLLPALSAEQLECTCQSEGAMNRLTRSVWVLSRIDESRTMAETISLAAETLAGFFDFPDMAVVLRDDDGDNFSVTGLWGLPSLMESIPASRFNAFVRQGRLKKCLPFDEEVRALFPTMRGTLATFFPFHYLGENFGSLVIFDRELTPVDRMHVELVTDRVGNRLVQIKREVEQTKVSTLSKKLITLTNTLLVADSKEELYRITLEIAADLLGATQGSIMLIDKSGETLSIVFTKGMSLNIAKCLTLKVGKGIAGTVAKSGVPLLVNDVEKDGRVGMVNRPRFKSKSLLCIPLKLKEKVIGVLNLSDKKDLSPFTEGDLQLLTSFSGLASLIIERYLLMEESCRFEQLSVTDPLTGLYNRRFLQSRLEEEFNRSIRQGLSLSVIFIDLDYFKAYNDICGHLAGDQALVRTAAIIKKTVRDMDIVARYGGEEFCAVLPATCKVEAMVVAERIRSEVERERFHGEELMPLGTVTTSLGIASFPEDGSTIESLLHASDVALYDAKARGRNQVVASAGPDFREEGALAASNYRDTGTDAKIPSPPPLYLAAEQGIKK